MKRLNQRGIGAIEGLLILLIVGLIGFVSWYVYQANNKTTVPKDQTTQTTTPRVVSTDGAVIAAAKASCEAAADSILQLGTQGPDQKKVMYSADKQFARINAACPKRGGGAAGFFVTYILKNIDSKWQVIDNGTMSDPAKVKQYNIPNDFSQDIPRVLQG